MSRQSEPAQGTRRNCLVFCKNVIFILTSLRLEENWDDDFQDAGFPCPSACRTSVALQNGGTRTGGSRSPVENWDDEFEDNPRNGTSPRRRTLRTPRIRSVYSPYAFKVNADGTVVQEDLVKCVNLSLACEKHH